MELVQNNEEHFGMGLHTDSPFRRSCAVCFCTPAVMLNGKRSGYSMSWEIENSLASHKIGLQHLIKCINVSLYLLLNVEYECCSNNM